MNTRTILILLVLTLAYSVGTVSAAGEFYCCTTSCYDYTDQSIVAAGCSGDVVQGQCSDPAVAPACQDTGCCVSGDSTSSCEIVAKHECADGSSFSGDIIEDAACSDICTAGTEPIGDGSCDDFTLEIRADHTPGESTVQVTWDMCDSIDSVTLLRGEGGVAPTLISIEFANSYTDLATKWGTSYQYQVQLIDDAGNLYEAATTITTGNIDCEDKATGVGFCSADGTERLECTAQNRIQRSACDGCDDSSGVVQCIGDTSACSIASAFLNVASQDACSAIEDGACYYDISTNGIGQCYSCSQATSCYEFKSASACTAATDTCDRFASSGCRWLASDGNINDGICAPQEPSADFCRFYTNPAGYDQSELYSPILSSNSDSESAQRFFEGAQLQCLEPGDTCIGTVSESACEALQPYSDYDCVWYDDGNERYCAKGDRYENPYFYSDAFASGSNEYLCEPQGSSETCEIDTTQPSLQVKRTITADSITYVPTVTDTDPVTGETFTLRGAALTDSDYTFRVCAQTGASCTVLQHYIKPLDESGAFTYTYDAHGILGEVTEIVFSAVVRDPGYQTSPPFSISSRFDPTDPLPTLSIETEPIITGGEPDGHDNSIIYANPDWTGTGTGKIIIRSDDGTIVTQETDVTKGTRIAIEPDSPFEYGDYTAMLYVTKGTKPPYEIENPIAFTITPPKFRINLLSPDGYLPPDGYFTIRVQTSETARGCRYRMTDSNPADASYESLTPELTGSGTSWSSTSVRRQESGWLQVVCHQDGRDAEASTKLWMEWQEVDKAPIITSIEADPKRLTSTALNSEAYESTIRVSTDRETVCSYVPPAGPPPVKSGEPDTVSEIPISLYDEGTYTIPVTCTARNTKNASATVEIIVTPGALWFSVGKPSGTMRTVRNVPYVVDTGGNPTTCEILPLGITAESEDGVIDGKFDATTYTEWYNGDGEYDLTFECSKESLDGGVERDKETVSFTIDTTKPQLTARINGQSGTIEENSTPSSTDVRFSYSDTSIVGSIAYTVKEMPFDQNAPSVIRQEGTLINLGTNGQRTVQFSFTPEDQHEYYVEARATDIAGNNRTVTSNRLNVDLPSACETGEMCGSICVDDGGGLCDLGDTCTTDSDCASGTECTEEGICYYDHCTNGILDDGTAGTTDHGEEEVDCGGVCGACFISLLEPTFGVSADRTTDVVIGTSETADCRYSDSRFTNITITDRTEGGTVHTIGGFTIGEGRTISVYCWNSERNGTKLFPLTWDDRDPVIEQFYANPNPVSWLTAPSNEYRTEFTVTSNLEVLCRIDDTDSNYNQMNEYLGNDYTTDSNEGSYSRIQQEWYGFAQPGSYTRYVDCIAKNGRTTGTSMTTFLADPNAKPELEIRTPEAGRTYSANSIIAKVDSQSTETLACVGELEDYGEQELTPDPSDGNVYVRDVNLGSDGRNLEYNAMCTYLLGASETNDTGSARFSVDTTGPEFIDLTISDPYGNESGVTNTPNAIEARIEAQDVISSVARYDYRVLVGSEEQASGTHPISGSTTFTQIINGLNLSDGERVRLEAVAIDTRGNEASGESNQLTYSYVPPPDTCSNGRLDDGEAAIDCGGQCGPCEGPAPYCGDGTPDYALGEQCDNGNENQDSCIAGVGDTCTVCTTSCEWYFGYTPPPTEPPVGVCGDGLTQTPNSAGINEQCDDGTQNTDATCTPDAGGSCTYCTTSCQMRVVVDTSNPAPEPTYCGDGYQQKPNDENVYEECDDGTQNTASCTPGESGYCNYCSLSCTFEVEIDDTAPPAPTYCGDGTVQSPNSVGFSEDCDRGTANSDDVCTPDAGGSCTICTSACVEITYTDDTTSPPDPTYCGDGFLQQPNDNGITEACDYGTENTNDACTPGEGETCEVCTTSCEIETYSDDPGYAPICGNGKLETDEQCDYGSANKDTCTADPGQSCSVCTTSCEIFTRSTPGEGPACNTNADCEGGSYCDDGTCREEGDVCTNGRYDPLYETDVDCGGTCGACDDGDTCTSDLDCEEYYYCSDDLECTPDFDAMCSNGVEDEDYEAGVDCGDICSSLFDQVCAPGESCSTDADCSTGYACTAGACVVDETGPQAGSWCSADEFNNTLEDGTYCGNTCDSRCEEGIGCRSSKDCVSGLICDDDTRTCLEPEYDNETNSCIPTNNVPPCGGDCAACMNGLDCIVDADCQSRNCESGICRSAINRSECDSDADCSPGESCSSGFCTPNTYGCYDDTDCEDGYACGEDGNCEKKGGGWWKWTIFFLLLVLLGVAGFIAYKYYYLPSKKPDYQEDQGMNADTMNAGFDDIGSADGSVNPPSGPPIMTEKQQHVNELIRQKRSEEKEQKRSEFFSAFDESKLDAEPETVDEDAVPKTKLESAPDDEKPIVATRKKSHDSFKEILDDAKDDLDE